MTKKLNKVGKLIIEKCDGFTNDIRWAIPLVNNVTFGNLLEVVEIIGDQLHCSSKSRDAVINQTMLIPVKILVAEYEHIDDVDCFNTIRLTKEVVYDLQGNDTLKNGSIVTSSDGFKSIKTNIGYDELFSIVNNIAKFSNSHRSPKLEYWRIVSGKYNE